jgi:hypothetical protein
MATSVRERVRQHRARRRAQGLIRVEVELPVALVQQHRRAGESLQTLVLRALAALDPAAVSLPETPTPPPSPPTLLPGTLPETSQTPAMVGTPGRPPLLPETQTATPSTATLLPGTLPDIAPPPARPSPQATTPLLPETLPETQAPKPPAAETVTGNDEARFIALWQQGVETPAIARALGLTFAAAQSRARRLQRRGLIAPRPRGGTYPGQRAQARQGEPAP